MRAFHLLALCKDVASKKAFYQGLVLSADNTADAEVRARSYIQKQGAVVVSFDEEETREVDPQNVGYEKRKPEEGVVGESGRVWIASENRRSVLAQIMGWFARLL